MKKVYRVRLEVKGKTEIVAVFGINMIQLVAQCERSGVQYTVEKIQGRL